MLRVSFSVFDRQDELSKVTSGFKDSVLYHFLGSVQDEWVSPILDSNNVLLRQISVIVAI